MIDDSKVNIDRARDPANGLREVLEEAYEAFVKLEKLRREVWSGEASPKTARSSDDN